MRWRYSQRVKKTWLWHAPQSTFDKVVNAISTVLRLVLVFMASGFVVAASSVGLHESGAVGALWFFVAGMAVFVLWNLWDIVKSWGGIPAAQLLVDESHIAIQTPFWRRSFMGHTFVIGEPMEMSVKEVSLLRVGKTIHIYEFRQGETKVRYFAPMYITERSERDLTQALASAGTRLTVPHISR